jgi:hypothetical protein
MATISKVITFYPTIGDNMELSEDKRMSVKMKAASAQAKQTELLKFVQMDPQNMMKEMMDTRQQGEIKKLLISHFIKFDNFSVADQATAEDVAKGKTGLVDGQELLLKEGDEYLRPGTMTDVFELGEYELAMEIFMHLIGSSQLRRAPEKKKPVDQITNADDAGDEEKNSESPSGTTRTHNVM